MYSSDGGRVRFAIELSPIGAPESPDPVSSCGQKERNKGVANQREGQEHTSLGLAQSKLRQV